jgi:hypothetical protein
MKKEGAVLTLVVISILLISISLVSAGLFGDVWGKITGKVTENETPEPEPEPKPCPTITGWRIEDNTCVEDSGCDYDDSYTYYGKEECESKLESPPEPPESDEEICCKITQLVVCKSCSPEVSYEKRLESECGYSLAPGAEVSYEIVADGYCEEHPPPPREECEEGDVKYYICEDGTKIPECECENKEWVCEMSVKDACPDVGPEPDTCASEIKITFNKDVYKLGDDVKVIIEILDLQGNHLPNYDFYAQMYDDRWHTPDLQKTDNKGYFIYTTIAEKPAGGVTEITFKVYTKETSSCKSVEDSTKVKFELEECGFGECAPDPGCRDTVRMCGGSCTPCPEDDGDIFYSCNGCELEGKCYPYGYRKAGNYCSDNNNVFVAQSGDDASCENNFECKTNLCIDGNCVSSNVWNKFLNWFKNIFGGDKKPTDCSKLLIEKDIENWEYFTFIYGETKESQVPVYSRDGTYLETIKCCMAGYAREETDEEKAALVCPYDDRQDLENSLYWILVKEGLSLEFDLTEYKDEEVYGSSDIAIVWTSDTYLVASGGDPRVGTPLSEDVTDAYLKKYKNDLSEIDLSYIPQIEPRPFVFCTEEDKEAAKECRGAPQSDPSSLDGTEEGKRECGESKGFGEGCCEVYTGCIMPDENCEEITIVSRDECYWHVARLNNDANLCEEITDSYYKDKCLEEAVTQDPNTCGKITDNTKQADCYVNLAVSTGDADLCKEIVYEIEHRDKCYVNVAEHTGDSRICGEIADPDLQEKCYFWVAEQAGNVDVCEEMTDVDLQVMCYVEVAEKTGDAGFCEKITEIRIRDKCYREVAIATNDRSLCEKIVSDDTPPLNPKDECYAGTS